MIFDELNSLDSLIQKYTALGWQFSKPRVLIERSDLYLVVTSPRMLNPAVISYHFDEEQLLAFERLSFARQKYEKNIAIALESLKEDMIKEVAAIQHLIDRGVHGAQVPSEIVVNELRVPLIG